MTQARFGLNSPEGELGGSNVAVQLRMLDAANGPSDMTLRKSEQGHSLMDWEVSNLSFRVSDLSSPNPALNLAPFGRWTLRDKTAQRRLALRWASP